MNRGLGAAKMAKQDEFYTQYIDIQKEVEAYLFLHMRILKLAELADRSTKPMPILPSLNWEDASAHK